MAGAVLVALVVIVVGWWPRAPSAPPVSVEHQSPAVAAGESAALDESWAPDGPVLAGRVVSVTDGDTIKVDLDSGLIDVRLHSIDTPERAQRWGPEAKAALASRLQGQQVALEPVEQDRYDRMIAVVYLGEENINAWLVRAGLAWVYRQYARDARYCKAEMMARVEQRGIWSLAATEQRPPWEWRAVKRGLRDGYSDYTGQTLERCLAALGKRPAEVTPLPVSDAAAASSPQGACRIKGNIGSSGKVYHVPGRSGYAKTKIDESQGERWFCTEDDARAAGWVKARS